ncbi:hypothetical protein CMU94_02145 [Elizabethkingia anophelis]|nr:hypothetical protein [Elizabethkingia anophelis]
MKHLLSIPKEFKQMHIDKFKQYLDEGYEIIEETQVNDFKCYVFEKKFDSIVGQLRNEMMSKRIEEANKVYQDAFTNQNIQKYQFIQTPRTYTDSELALSKSVEMFQLIKDRINNGK